MTIREQFEQEELSRLSDRAAKSVYSKGRERQVDACPMRTAREGIARLRTFFRSIGMPVTLAEIGAKEEDIPAMVAHRGEKPNGFPFGGFMKIGPEEMAEILRLAR